MGMFSNENTTTFGGTIGNVNKTQNGCLKFGICQEYPTMVDRVPTKAANWLNVLLSEKQSTAFAAKIKRGDEITVEGELRITQYNGHPSITLFVKKIVKIRPGEHRALVGLYYAYMNNPEMLDMITNQDLMKGLLDNTLRAFQQRGGVPQKGQNAQSAQPQVNQAKPLTSQPASQPVQSQPVVNEQPASQPASQPVQSQPVVNEQPVRHAQMTTSIPQEIIDAATTQGNEEGYLQEPVWLNNKEHPQDILQEIAGAVASATVGEHNFYTRN